jgi:hypothetical protein
MWDLTVPGNGDHDFYIDTAVASVLVHNCPVGPKSPDEFIEPTNTAQYPPSEDELPQGYRVRVMKPTADYPNGYWRMTNDRGQPVDPSNFKPVGNVSKALFNAMTHVPLP